MAKLQLGNKPLNHSTTHWDRPVDTDVRQFFGRFNPDFQQSKSDQILRLLNDQDTLTKRLTHCGISQQIQQQAEPQQTLNGVLIRDRDDDEDTLVSDADTNSDNTLSITSSSSVSEQEEVNMEEERRPLQRQAGGRSKTSVGFYNDIVNQDEDGLDADVHNDSRRVAEPERPIDTRINRPQSSYVRRRFRNTETYEDGRHGSDTVGDTVDSNTVRPTRSARPRSRLGNRPIPAESYRRKIPLTEVNSNQVPPSDEELQTATMPNREEMVNNGAASYERYASTKTPAPKFKRDRTNIRTFCDDAMGPDMMDNGSPVVSMDVQEEITVIQSIKPNDNKQTQNVSGGSLSSHSKHQMQHQQQNHPHHQQFQQHHQQHHQPPQYQIHQQQMQQIQMQKQQHLQQTHQQYQSAHGHQQQQSHHQHQHPRTEQSPNQNYHNRPKNPEPIMSRPIGRADIRPNTRRRLERRYMQQNQKNPLSSARPTSESVILARQKTEKNLLKAQAANDRPKSERILLGSANKSVLSVARNPAQGPQTMVQSKNDITQASHVHTSGFRGYDPGSRGKDPGRRELPGDLNMQPRAATNRRPLALMKLPPLEASMAKKSERGISIARETCV